jgi:uncharacterized protein (TIGR03000 family)
MFGVLLFGAAMCYCCGCGCKHEACWYNYSGYNYYEPCGYYCSWYPCYGGCACPDYGFDTVPPPPAPPVKEPKTGPERAPKPSEGASVAPGARLIVEVPADARLYIHDHLMEGSGSRRAFVTPALKAGQTYYYVMRADVTRDGKVRSETRRVEVKAGDTAQASFAGLGATANGGAVVKSRR